MRHFLLPTGGERREKIVFGQITPWHQVPPQDVHKSCQSFFTCNQSSIIHLFARRINAPSLLCYCSKVQEAQQHNPYNRAEAALLGCRVLVE